MAQFIDSDQEVVWGGIPFSLSVYDEGITETIETDPVTTYSRRIYAINIIKKTSIVPPDPSSPEEFSTVWKGNRLALSQDSDGKLYLRAAGFDSVSSPVKEITIMGMPLGIGQYDELIFHDSEYTLNDIEEYSKAMIGGMPLTAGRIGNKWYLILYYI
jgi:hypothetical protein